MSRLRKISEEDLPLLLSWRNDPTIRSYMFNPDLIKLEEHIQWYTRISGDERYTLLIYEDGGSPIGHMNFTQKPGCAIAEWGFYVSPTAPKGTGSKMATYSLEFAFKELKLLKVSAQVLAHNDRSLHLHRKLGFQQEGVLRAHHFDGNGYHDIHCFGLLANEWQQKIGKEFT